MRNKDFQEEKARTQDPNDGTRFPPKQQLQPI